MPAKLVSVKCFSVNVCIYSIIISFFLSFLGQSVEEEKNKKNKKEEEKKQVVNC